MTPELSCTSVHSDLKGKLMQNILIGITILFAIVTTVQAADKTAKCVIESNAVKVFDGKCKFMSEAGGSFSLSNANEKPLFDEVTIVSVNFIEKGNAEVRGLTTRGNNSRWGEAKRSSQDPACWVGTDFKVCAR